MKIQGIDLHPGQQAVVEAIKGPAQYVTVLSPRQCGKSTIGNQVLLYWAINNKNARVFATAPTYAQCQKPFDEIYDGIYKSGILKSANKSELKLTFHNGSTITFKSIERPDNIRGFVATHLYCDEAAYYPDTVWPQILRPITMVNKAPCLFVSTPRSNNWFKNMYDMGLSDEHPQYASVRMKYEQNPFVDLNEIQEAKRTLPEHIFKAEYEGSFVDSGSTVFTNIEQCTFDRYPSRQGRVYLSVDLGRQNDWTVATAIDDAGNVLEIYRDNQKEWDTMIQNIVDMARKWDAQVLVEANSIGDVVLGQIKKQWPKTEGFNTTSQSKQQIIEALIVAFNRGDIGIPSKELFGPLQFELEIFEYKYSTQSRSVQYQAPSSFHDDCVMSLAIGWYAREKMKTSGQYVYSSSNRRY